MRGHVHGRGFAAYSSFSPFLHSSPFTPSRDSQNTTGSTPRPDCAQCGVHRQESRFLSNTRTNRAPAERELDLAFHEHHELFHVVHEIAPHLTRRIDPVLEPSPGVPIRPVCRAACARCSSDYRFASGRLRMIASSWGSFSRSDSALRRNSGSALHIASRSLGSCLSSSRFTSSRCCRIAPSYLPTFRACSFSSLDRPVSSWPRADRARRSACDGASARRRRLFRWPRAVEVAKMHASLRARFA